MKVSRQLPGLRTRRASAEIERPAGKGRQEKRKKIVFYTTEATNLLKTKIEAFGKGPNRTVFYVHIGLKKHPKTAILANSTPHLHPPRARSQGLHGVSNPTGSNRRGWGRDTDPSGGGRSALRAFRSLPAETAQSQEIEPTLKLTRSQFLATATRL